MATKQEIEKAQAQIQGLTPEQQAGARSLAENYKGQGKDALEATNLALSSYNQPKPQETQVIEPITTTPINNVTPVENLSEISAQQREPAIQAAVETPQPATQVEKTTTITPQGETVVKKETPQVIAPDYNKGKGREQDILTNLNEGYSKDPAIQKAISTGDYNTFKQAYGYDTADQTKKTMLDAFFQARQPKDSEGIYQILKTGQKIANPAISQSRDFIRAQTKYNMFSKLNGMDSNQLLTEMKNNNIGTDMDKELAMNPQYQLAKQKYNQYQNTKSINEKNESLSNSISDKKTTYTDPSQKLSDSVTSGKSEEEVGTYREYLAKNNPDIVTKVSELNAKNKSLREMADARDAMYKTVIAEHPGISKSSAIALAARLNEPLNEQIKSASYELEQLSSDIKYQEGIAREDYAYQQKQQESEQAFEQAKELARFNQTLGLETKQKEFEQQIEQQAMAAKDPVLATQSILDTYAKMGILPTRSSAEIIAEVQRQVAAGKPVGEAITDLNKAFQSKPEYKRAMELQAGQMTDREKMQLAQQYNIQNTRMDQAFALKQASAKNITDNKLTKLDDGMYQDSNGNVYTKDEITQAKLYNNAYITKEVGEIGGDCGFYASRGTGLNTTPGGNSKEKRIEAFSDSEPVVGGMAYFTGPGYDQTYGHISIVTGVDEANGTITLKESNYKGDQTVTTRTVPMSSVTGYYNSTPLAGGAGTTTENPEAKKWIGVWNSGTMDLETILTKLGSSKESLPIKTAIADYVQKQGGVAFRKSDDPAVKQVENLKTTIDDLLSKENNDYLEDVSGAVQVSPWDTMTSRKQDYLGNIQFVLDSKTLQNLIDAKAQGATFGALSNEELKMLQASSSLLNARAIRDDKGNITGFDMSEAAFKKALEQLQGTYSEKITRMTGGKDAGNTSQGASFTTSSGNTYNTNEYK